MSSTMDVWLIGGLDSFICDGGRTTSRSVIGLYLDRGAVGWFSFINFPFSFRDTQDNSNMLTSTPNLIQHETKTSQYQSLKPNSPQKVQGQPRLHGKLYRQDGWISLDKNLQVQVWYLGSSFGMSLKSFCCISLHKPILNFLLQLLLQREGTEVKAAVIPNKWKKISLSWEKKMEQ